MVIRCLNGALIVCVTTWFDIVLIYRVEIMIYVDFPVDENLPCVNGENSEKSCRQINGRLLQPAFSWENPLSTFNQIIRENESRKKIVLINFP